MSKLLKYSLLIFFLLPLLVFSESLRGTGLVSGIIIFLIIAIIVAAIPIIGLFQEKFWFFPYAYVVIAVYVLVIAILLLPWLIWAGPIFVLVVGPGVVLYFGAFLTLLINLHKQYRLIHPKLPVEKI